MLTQQEDTKWRQRAKQIWYQLGDKNINFFHACATQNRRTNRIYALQDQNNISTSQPEKMARILTTYFKSLFHSSHPSNRLIEHCTSKVTTCVTTDMNEALLAPFTLEKIKTTLLQMAPLKSLRPDGFSACFYQSYWHNVKDEVCSTILLFLNEGVIDDQINDTHLILIPKISHPTRPSDF